MKNKNLTEKEKREKDFTEETIVIAVFFAILDIIFYGIKQNEGLLVVMVIIECFAMCIFALGSNNSPMNNKNR